MKGYCEPKSSSNSCDSFHGTKWVSDMDKKNTSYSEMYCKVKKKFNLNKKDKEGPVEENPLKG